ncbi:hypothetical protein A3A64_03365 [Candidatus Gottesmanbacteria bacterium RIFCSPLOWO2_01_FULL_48_11]|uniref:EamA family transporter n=2 Tax=Candidatus Gottesmaniibacteriota TaxID=1752720 RepID=A0A0G1UM23_9BACT|nr:MAG: EamA family transporter [Candidatus Gottesmanbacteria bacterium GW2011_GWA1_48_13]OGG27766.1 MAG: hypothetical protein A3A64_03365 [Candidatus Gottesmanbacteria bacterium RIFCSPLOWO2_01_FULL_48_11]
MSWFIFAIISVVSSSVSNIVQRAVMRDKESDPVASSILFQFILTFITGIFALYKGFTAPPIINFPLQFMVSATFYGVGTLCMFQAAKRIEASEKTILSAFGAIVTIVVALIFLNESFTIRQFFGTGLVLLSVVLIQNKLGIVRSIGTLYAILGTSLYAVAVVSDTFILRHYDAISYTPVMSFLPGVVLLLVNPSVIKRFKSILNGRYIRNMFLYGFFYGIQAIMYYLALSLGANASQMAPLFRSEIVLTVLLAVFLLGERKKLGIKLLSAVIVSIGVFLIK